LANIQPFQPYDIQPRQATPARLLTQPYDKINPEMQARYLAASPYNLVRVILGERPPTDNDADNVYTRAARYLDGWIRDGILAQDPAPGLYAYFQEFEVPDSGQRLTRKGFIGLGKIEDYSRGGVPARADLERAEERSPGSLAAHARAISGRSSCCIPTRRVRWTGCWRRRRRECGARCARRLSGAASRVGITDPSKIARIQELMTPKKLLIADGHHRYETALAFRNENPDVEAAST